MVKQLALTLSETPEQTATTAASLQESVYDANEDDYYRMLRVWRGANQQIIEAAYVRRLRQCDGNREEIGRLTQAFRVLANQKSRWAYDARYGSWDYDSLMEAVMSEITTSEAYLRTLAFRRRATLLAVASAVLATLLLIGAVLGGQGNGRFEISEGGGESIAPERPL
jgi:hypothetical protein